MDKLKKEYSDLGKEVKILEKEIKNYLGKLGLDKLDPDDARRMLDDVKKHIRELNNSINKAMDRRGSVKNKA